MSLRENRMLTVELARREAQAIASEGMRAQAAREIPAPRPRPRALTVSEYQAQRGD